MWHLGTQGQVVIQSRSAGRGVQPATSSKSSTTEGTICALQRAEVWLHAEMDLHVVTHEPPASPDANGSAGEAWRPAPAD